ncbi:hypothetical protein Vretimale_14710 [Volvox reticuliferus]|uniref:N-acetyltransferase domain-containing protein n=1 Tax=Volvox reticuliferus TaxID=1737510 RepID=A0A8J4CU26_9CHLO|nr:hypothetical protein Vretifemale_15659 [Volvox reticuliferus]GIM11170.1 hypothetical protein Vretimale_14710 [Volvox reticuliferus]
MRPAGGLGRGNACVCTAQAGWNSLGGITRSKAYPPLTYSINRRDIAGAELGMLLAASSTDAMDGLHHAAKLEVALRHSVATVACFTTWNVYGEAVASASASSGGSSGAEARCESGRGAGLLRSASDGQASQQQQLQQLPAHRLAWHQQQHLDWEQQQPQQQQQQQQQQGSCEPAWRRELYRSYSSTSRSTDRGTATSAVTAEATLAAGRAAAAEGAAAGTASPSHASRPSSTSVLPSHVPSSSSFSPISSSHSAVRSSLRSYGDKPPPPPGVPDMDWNWLLTSNRSGNSNSSSNSRNFISNTDIIIDSCNCSNSGSSTDAGDYGDGGWSLSSSSSSSALAQRALWSWSNSSTSTSSSTTTTTSMSSSSSQGSRKHLVGFARATGDNSLVATIYDVAVHPAVRGQGIGSRLVKLLVQQIQARAVYDIGVVTPAEAFKFWERCAFDNDREGSTFMTFVGRPVRQLGGDYDGTEYNEQVEAAQDEVGFGAPRNSQELLDLSDLGFWDAATRSDSLQELLASKLQRLKEAEWGLAAVTGAEAGMVGGGGGRRTPPGDGRVRWGAPRPRSMASGRSYLDTSS